MRGDAERRLRQDALGLVEAALAAVDPERCVAGRMHAAPGGLVVDGALEEVRAGRLLIVAVGKAAAGMARAAVAAAANLEPRGLLVVPAGTPAEVSPLESLAAEHPVPGEGSRRAAARVADLVDGAGPGDLVVVLLSGGASSLLGDIPEGLTLAQVGGTVTAIQRSGGSIEELNLVRRRLGTLKGGGLAALAAPARVVTLLVSDVPGSDPAVIGSGPTTADPHGDVEALRVLRRLADPSAVPDAVLSYLEERARRRAADGPTKPTPGSRTVVVADNAMALRAAARQAGREGRRVRLLHRPILGHARAAGTRLARLLRRARAQDPRPLCLLAGGETVVRVTGSGVGGRNQELAAAAALELDGHAEVCLCSVGTDGIDGPTPAAGALATGSTLRRAAAAGISVSAALADNDTYRLWSRLGDLVITGPTGTNVMDIQILLAGAR